MILVTGATGFLGKHLLREMDARGLSYRAMSRVQGKEVEAASDNPGAKWVTGDVNDPESLVEAMQGISTVIHAAAMVSFQSEDRDELLLVNGEGTANVVNMALEVGVQHLVHVSSVAVLNRKPSGPIVTLGDRWPDERPNSAYAESKFDAERQVWRGQAEGLSVSVVYPSTIIGPGNFEGMNTPSLWRYAAKERSFYPSGRAGFVDVRDVVDAILHLAEAKEDGARLLLNAGNLTWKAFLTEVADSIGAKPPTRLMPEWQSALLWPVDKVRTMVTGTKPIITRETHRSTQSDFRYDGSSFNQALNRPYRDIRTTIAEVGQRYQTAVAVQ